MSTFCPRGRKGRQGKDIPPVELTSKADLDAGRLSAHVRPLKVDVDLVLVPVTITDPLNRLVTDLEKENFQLFDGNSPQEIRLSPVRMRRFLSA